MIRSGLIKGDTELRYLSEVKDPVLKFRKATKFVEKFLLLRTSLTVVNNVATRRLILQCSRFSLVIEEK